eukprot:scaffold10353_cov127-Isochrysis_galbana.AAC.1
MLADLDRLAARALLAEDEPGATALPVDAEALQLWLLLARGAYDAVLRSALADELLGSLLDVDAAHGAAAAAAVTARVGAYLLAHPTPTAAAAVTWVGAAALCRFVQCNWSSKGGGKGSGEAGVGPASARAGWLSALGVDGEEAYVLLASPQLLVAARALLIQPAEALAAAAGGGRAPGCVTGGHDQAGHAATSSPG